MCLCEKGRELNRDRCKILDFLKVDDVVVVRRFR